MRAYKVVCDIDVQGVVVNTATHNTVVQYDKEITRYETEAFLYIPETNPMFNFKLFIRDTAIIRSYRSMEALHFLYMEELTKLINEGL